MALTSLLALAVAGGCGDAPPPEPQLPEHAATVESATRFRGLWVLCEGSARTLEDPARIEALVEHAEALEVTDLFVQVFRGGRSWFDSSRSDTSPFEAIRGATGLDPLAETLQRAHAAGIRVHAWVNVLSLSRNREAKILEDLGPDAVHVDRRGRSVLDYPGFDLPAPDREYYRMGTRGLYLDPGAEGVREWLTAAFIELLARYPGLDGLHLDYIRHPLVLPISPGSRFGVGLDFGYGQASRERFRRETGLPGPWRGSDVAPASISGGDAWDDWRRDQVTALVASIRDASDALRPGVQLSAAVMPYADRAYLALAQDWRGWLEKSLIDFAVPMVYTRDNRLFRYQVDSFGAGSYASRLWAGLGVWLFADSPAGAVAQVELAFGSGMAGDALFSYDAIADSPALYSALVEAAGGRAAVKEATGNAGLVDADPARGH